MCRNLWDRVGAVIYKLGAFTFWTAMAGAVFIAYFALVAPWYLPERLSAIQIVVEMAGFAILVHQLTRQRQQELRAPKLEVWLRPPKGYVFKPNKIRFEKKSVITRRPPHGTTKYWFDVVFNNDGSAAAKSFTVDFTLPAEVVPVGVRKYKKYPDGGSFSEWPGGAQFSSGDQMVISPKTTMRLGPIRMEVTERYEYFAFPVVVSVVFADGVGNRVFVFMLYVVDDVESFTPNELDSYRADEIDNRSW